ncbi:hypothetical protein D3C71_924220 [compost metagenome]
MKAHAALERTDGRAVLHAPGAIDVGLALVVGPCHAELNHPLRFDQPLQQPMLRVLRVALQEGPQAVGHFLHCLQELGLVGITLGHMGQEVVGATVVQEHSSQEGDLKRQIQK